MEDFNKMSLEQIRAFMEGSQEIKFQALNRAELYGWVERVLWHHGYGSQPRQAKGLLRRFVRRGNGAEQGTDHTLDRGLPEGLRD